MWWWRYDDDDGGGNVEVGDVVGFETETGFVSTKEFNWVCDGFLQI